MKWLLIMLALLAGCTGSPNENENEESLIVGTWTGVIPEGPAFEWVFGEDGNWTMLVDGRAQSGSYTLEGSTVSLTTPYGEQFHGTADRRRMVLVGSEGEDPLTMVFKSSAIEHERIRIAQTAFDDLGNLGHVLLDRSNRAYVVVLGLPQDTPKEQLAKVREAADEGVELIEWETFKPQAHAVLTERIRHDFYGMKLLLGDFLYGIQNRAGVPFGLTWNGGIAMTANDYRHAEQTLQEYEADPETYAKQPQIEQREDPVHPFNHLPFLMMEPAALKPE